MLLESLPDRVVATIETRNAWRRKLAQSDEGLEFVVSDLSRWRPGSVVRIAFLDGDTSLHADIEAACGQIADACNLVLDFGKDASGDYRRWTEQDTDLTAEIRVSFDSDGYWSLVGTDSIDPAIGGPGSPEGGGPGQRSLNLGGYKTDKPAGWEGTVRHEFLHALAFHHSHQNMRGACQEEFRWEDDPGYQPTQDQFGQFVADSDGRVPGIYTYLSGAPNFWSRATVDHNLRAEDSEDVIFGPFDSDSVMLYQFEPFFYRSNPSECAPTGNGVDLSKGDKRGLALLYPRVDAEIEAIEERVSRERAVLDGGLESAGATSTYKRQVRELLEAWAS